MDKRRKRTRTNQHRRQQPLVPSKLLCTLPAIRMLKDALHLVDAAFMRTTKPLPNLELGRQVLTGLQQKLDDMLQREDWTTETPFDANELHMLYAAIHMYLVELSATGDQQRLAMCLQLCGQLGGIMDTMPPKRLPAPKEKG